MTDDASVRVLRNRTAGDVFPDMPSAFFAYRFVAALHDARIDSASLADFTSSTRSEQLSPHVD